MKRIFFLLVILFCVPQVVWAQEVNPRFGVIESYEAADAATRLGVGFTRVRFPWAEVQPNSPDEWIPKVADELISAEIAANREVVGLLIGIPQWARDSADLPHGLYLPRDDPNNLWANYVRTTLTRHPEITHWVIWNEPDIWDENALGYTWHGTEADFAQLMRVGYLTAKEINPEIVVHLSAMTFFWDNNFGRTQYLDRLLTELVNDPDAAAHNHYFDVATAHLYFQPNQILSIMDIWRGIMEKHGLGDKPWWLMETNAPVSDDPTWAVDDPAFVVSQIDQANYIGQATAVAMTLGVERVAIFKLIDTESDRFANPEPFGLVRADGVERVGFQAYQTVIDLFDEIESAERLRWDSVGHVRLTHSDGVTDVLFAREGVAETVEVACVGGCDSAELIDPLGNRQTITPTDDHFTIQLPASLCNQPIGDGCMIGGDTHYLVQRNSPEPTIVATITIEPTQPATEIVVTVPPQPTSTAPTMPSESPPSANRPTAFIVAVVLIGLGATAIFVRTYVK